MTTTSKPIRQGPYRHQVSWFDGTRSIITQSATKPMAALALALALAACDTPSKPRVEPASTWEIGPVIRGKNYSVAMPLTPAAHDDGVSFDFGPGQSPHYVTQAAQPLTGKHLIRLRFRTEGSPIIGSKCGSGTATVYLEKRGNDWAHDGGRWWATFSSVTLGEPGAYEIVAPLDGPWTSVSTMTATASPAEFQAAKDTASRIGFTLGNCEGFGHGITTSTGTARVVVTYFGVE